jgi:glycosyltransferase involved in cell wall biosynthesis
MMVNKPVFKEKKIVVVMPAYNASETLRRTYDEVMAQQIVDQVIVVDDILQIKAMALIKKPVIIWRCSKTPTS